MTTITSLSQLDLSKTYSYADYLTWQFSELVELIKGRLWLDSPAPRREHQDYSGNVFHEIKTFLKHKPCRVYHAPFDVRLTTGGANGDQDIQTVVQPDICVVCDPAKLDDRGCLGAPDWIVEIVSPGNTARDTKIKFDLYEESGVGEYWLVYPGVKTVAAFVLQNGRYILDQEYFEPGPVPVRTLPGLALAWEDIFDLG